MIMLGYFHHCLRLWKSIAKLVLETDQGCRDQFSNIKVMIFGRPNLLLLLLIHHLLIAGCV